MGRTHGRWLVGAGRRRQPFGARRIRWWAMVGAVVVMAAAFTGCSGGEVTPQAYFDNLASATNDYEDALAALREDYRTELEEELGDLLDGTDFSDTAAVDAFFDQSKEVAIVKTADLFSQSAAALRTMLDELEAMEPPEDLVQQHEDAIAAGEALLASMPITIEAVRSLDAMDELEETIEAAPYFVANQRFGIACENLETAGTAEGLDIDLSCPEGVVEEVGG